MNEIDYGYTKRSVDKHIRFKIARWVKELGAGAPEFLKSELGINEADAADTEEKVKAFREQIIRDVIVTGGCFTSMLQGEKPNDVDVYFRTRASAKLVATYYINRLLKVTDITTNTYAPYITIEESDDGIQIKYKSQGVASEDITNKDYRYFEMQSFDKIDEFFATYNKRRKQIEKDPEDKTAKVDFLTSNAITLSNGIQVITRFTGSPEEIHANFDFIHATNYWTWHDGVVYNVEALQATLERRLYYFGSKFPVASIFRMKKFLDRGWRISAGEMLKIMYDISHLNLDDPLVLREQSIGMDSAYFCQVIRMLANKSGDIDRTYLFQCIDKVFKDTLEPKELDFEEEEDTNSGRCSTIEVSAMSRGSTA